MKLFWISAVAGSAGDVLCSRLSVLDVCKHFMRFAKSVLGSRKDKANDVCLDRAHWLAVILLMSSE